MENKPLKKIKEIELYYYEDNNMVNGKNKNMMGNCSKLSGNCSRLRGDCSGLSGDCSGLSGDLDLITKRPSQLNEWVE